MNALRFMLLLAFCGQITIVWGCFCVTPDDSVQNADVIFTGVAQDVNNGKESFEESFYNLFWATEFLIDSVIKGLDYFVVGDKVTILQESTNCMYSFEQDSVYLVFARYVPVYEEEPEIVYPFLTTGQCTGTNKISKDEIKNPFEKEDMANEPERHAHESIPIGWFIASVILNVLLISLFFYFGRLSKSKR
ncbi:MAG: hypothetical protein R3B47_10985 [Bacteroidia bacterium]